LFRRCWPSPDASLSTSVAVAMPAHDDPSALVPATCRLLTSESQVAAHADRREAPVARAGVRRVTAHPAGPDTGRKPVLRLR
jgi:hypothetical protein